MTETAWDWGVLVQYAGHQGLGWLLLAVVLLSLILLRAVPAARPTLFNTLLLFAVSLVGLLFSALLFASGLDAAAASLRELFLLIEGMAAIRLAGLALFRWLLPLLRLAPPRILEDMAVIAAYLVWAMVRLRYAGLDLSGIVATSAVITAVLAFSMQDTLGNILGGIALQLDDSLQVGDWIKVDDVTGRVVDIRWRSTSVETRNWETVVIPNSQLMKGKFVVLGRRQGQPEQWRRWVWFNISYGVPPARVIDVVERALRHTAIPNVAHQPLPNCVMMDFSDSAARYAVRYWLTDLAVDDPTDSAVRQHIYAALQRAGIEPCIPEQYVHVEKESAKHEALRQARELQQRLAFLHQVDLFRTLTEDELRLVAERLKYTPFVRGDVITQQGAVAHWLYILTEGEAEVVLEAAGGQRPLGVIDAARGPGFFGEMGLMTGEPRTATVIARSDVECYRLDKASFESIIQSRPALAEEISHVMASRRGGLDSARQALDEQAHGTHVIQGESEMLRKIRRFFRLEPS
ncbi:MAG: mechanosensitive ion channel family protein [Pseudomonadota bacterium]